MRLLNRDFDSSDPEWATGQRLAAATRAVRQSGLAASALWALKNHADDPVFLDAFLRKLERLAASFHIRRIYTTPRVTRYNELLKQLADGTRGTRPSLRPLRREKQDTLEKLGSRDLSRRQDHASSSCSAPTRSWLVHPGVTYQHKQITIEHVLPQTSQVETACG